VSLLLYSKNISLVYSYRQILPTFLLLKAFCDVCDMERFSQSQRYPVFQLKNLVRNKLLHMIIENLRSFIIMKIRFMQMILFVPVYIIVNDAWNNGKVASQIILLLLNHRYIELEKYNRGNLMQNQSSLL
jgi:hypothetical protein